MKSKCPKQIKTNKQDNKQPSQDQKKTPNKKPECIFEGTKVVLNFTIAHLWEPGRKQKSTFRFQICILKYVFNLTFYFILILIWKQTFHFIDVLKVFTISPQPFLF